ncbi:MAG TPA: hypothetical protein VMS18_03490 [Candidatus Binatia bacterium]|nr:hypothetical protein [Candidatus Binatia bacterium]
MARRRECESCHGECCRRYQKENLFDFISLDPLHFHIVQLKLRRQYQLAEVMDVTLMVFPVRVPVT